MDNFERPMDDAERRRTMDFILRQQAQFAANSQRNEEKLETLRRVVVLMARQFRNDRSDLKERINALIDAQMSSEEKQSRSSEWQTQMERNFARSEARMTKLEKGAERNSKESAALLQTTKRNSEAIEKLAASHDRNSQAITKLTESQDSNREAIAALLVSTKRNSEAIAKLTEVVTDIARRRNGDDDSA
jgi:chromosome segregation ATPase